MLVSFLVPYRWNRGDYRFPRRLSVSLSSCLSVGPFGVRQLGFPNFSQSSFEILTWNLVQWWFVNPGSDNPEISIIRTKSAGTNFRSWTDGRFSNPENLLIRKYRTGTKMFRINESSLYMDLSWHNTDQVRDSSRLTYFYRSYCPLLKFRFANISLFVWDIDLKFGLWICLDII